MVKLIRGKYSSKLLGAGTVLNLSKDEENRLVDRKVAVKVDVASDDSLDTNNGISGDIEYPHGSSENATVYKTEDELRKMKSKKEIIEYAQSIGLTELDDSNKKDELIDAVLNYIDEILSEE